MSQHPQAELRRTMQARNTRQQQRQQQRQGRLPNRSGLAAAAQQLPTTINQEQSIATRQPAQSLSSSDDSPPTTTNNTNTNAEAEDADHDDDDEDDDNATDVDANAEAEAEAEAEPEPDPPPSPTLREISSLASWTVSTYKPGCGVRELLSPSILSFWQSDGPQPHLLTIHFFKVVGIVRLRIYLDQELDESYTPTRMVFAAGMGEHDLVEFAEWRGEDPAGWEEVDLDGVGGRDSGRGYGVVEMEGEGNAAAIAAALHRPGRDEGRVLRCMCLQVRVMENHQNGKDTHVRAVQVFARDESSKREGVGMREEGLHVEGKGPDAALERLEVLSGLSDALLEPEWARDMVIR